MIRVHTLTEATGEDATTALDLLTAVDGPLVRVTADAASDTVAVYETGRWCADAGRPTRFKPSSPSPTDAVRDGSTKLGHPVQNVTREHGLTPLPR